MCSNGSIESTRLNPSFELHEEIMCKTRLGSAQICTQVSHTSHIHSINTSFTQGGCLKGLSEINGQTCTFSPNPHNVDNHKFTHF